MAERKEYTLRGIGADVEFGKGGGRFQWVVDHWEGTEADGSTLAQIRVPALPVNNNDATSKQYVDNIATGLDAKDSVRVATTSNLASLSGLLTIDGVSLNAGDRVLVKNQTTTSSNGIYVAASGSWNRSQDTNSTGEITGGSFTFVEEGAVNGDTGWVVSSDGSPTVGTDPITWVQFSSAGVASAGTGLTKTGTVFNVNLGATTINVDGGDDLIVNSSATANQVLLSAGSIGTEASWGALPLDNVNSTTGLLPKDRGGLNTDITAFADGSLIVTDNTNGDVDEITIGAANTVLRSNGTTPVWGNLDLSTDVTGLLPQVNGGLNTDISGFADESLFVMDNTNGDVNEISVGTNGNALIVSGGAVTWGQIDLADGTNAVTGTLAEANGGTGESTYTQGDILYADAANSLAKLPLGIAGQVLQSDGTDVTWDAVPASSGSIVTIEADVTFNGGATQAIGSVPANGRVIKVMVDVTTAWDQTETVEIGDSGDIDRLMVATANDPEQQFLFTTDLNNLYASATTVNATITNANAPTTGSARVIVQYIAP